MEQVVYVLTGDSLEAARRYVMGLCLSLTSLRRFHKSAIVTCFCDSQLYQLIRRTNHPVLRIVDQLCECQGVIGGPIHRSRWIKTTLRERISGPFVYIDVDTLIAGPLDELFTCEHDLGLTLDPYFVDSPGEFPGWLHSHYRRLGWEPCSPYYNGGVFSVKQSQRAIDFFQAWHRYWFQGVCQAGLFMDQPALNHALDMTRPGVEQFSESYNFLVGRVARSIPENTRLMSFLASQAGPRLGDYETLLAQPANTFHVEAQELARLTEVGKFLPELTRPWHMELRRRFWEATRFFFARHGLVDVCRY